MLAIPIAKAGPHKTENPYKIVFRVFGSTEKAEKSQTYSWSKYKSNLSDNTYLICNVRDNY